jgi:hypothetical protein
MKTRFILYAICISLNNVAFAEPLVTFNYKVAVDRVNDYSNILGGQVQAGDVIEVSLTYDAATPDVWTDDPSIGQYFFLSGENRWQYGFNAKIGQLIWELSPLSQSIKILNDHQQRSQIIDSISVNNYITSSQLPCDKQAINLELVNTNNLDVISSDTLPIAPPKPSQFEIARITISASETSCEFGYIISGKILPK